MGKPGRLTNVIITFGYLLMISVLVFSGWFIRKEMNNLLSFDQEEENITIRRNAITRALSNLYELEAIGLMVSAGNSNQFPAYRKVMGETIAAIDTLKNFSSDSLQLLRIDSISDLIRRKEVNILALLNTQKSAQADRIYRENIERIISEQDSIVAQQQIQHRVIVNRDSVMTHKEKKGFFKRLAEAFNPHKEDSTLIVNTYSTIVADTITSPFNKTDTVVAIFRTIQEEVNLRQQEIEAQLNLQAGRLRVDSRRLSTKINQLLRDFEEEVVAISLRKIEQQQIIRQNSIRTISAIGLGTIVLSIFFLIIIWRDLAKSSRYRKELEKANSLAEGLLQSREQMILAITHDFKAPLGSIIGYTDLLSRLTKEERATFYLDSMKNSSQLLLNLVNSLLDFHRLDLNKVEINRVSFNPCELLLAVEAGFTPLAQAKGLNFIFTVSPELNGNFISDPLRIRQITDNLISNAIKFTESGSVKVRADYKAGGLNLAVTDTGKGMSPEDTGKIFREFTRLPGAQGEEGFGLGLSIVKKLVDLLEGTLNVSSTEGKGSCFILNIPLYRVGRAEDILVEKEPEHRDTPAKTGYRILMIDDDRIQLTLTAAMLKNTAIELTCCLHPEELVEYLRNETFDYLLTDVQMPAINGFDLLKLLRASHIQQAREIRTIAVTARNDMQREDFIKEGFYDCLYKPFTAEELLRVLAQKPLTALPRKEPVEKGIDFPAIIRFCGEDTDAAKTIVDSFINETQSNCKQFEEALQRKDVGVLSGIAHKMLPLMTLIKAENIRKLLVDIERSKPDNDNCLVWEKGRKLLEEVDRVVKEAAIFRASFDEKGSR